jgi:aryl-alcohol dehydrogenase-like predicted oxidoreductase
MKMEFKKLGRTGINVSTISLGTVEIGLDYGISPDGQAARPLESQSARLLHRALDLGVNFIDTARAYGESEAIIGRALKGRRHEFVVCSKVLVQAGGPAETLREKVTESLHTSLRALATDSIDIMMIHSAPLEILEWPGLIGILEDLRRSGKFRWIGASVYGEDAALYAIRSGHFECLQVAFSALDRRPERHIWEEASRHDVGIVARSVLLKGVLTPRYRYLPDHLSELRVAVRELEDVAKAAGMSLPELAYRYVLSNALPHTALVGASNIDELESAVCFAQAGVLPGDMVSRIHALRPLDEHYLNPATWGVG